jgi:hypothetical protein
VVLPPLAQDPQRECNTFSGTSPAFSAFFTHALDSSTQLHRKSSLFLGDFQSIGKGVFFWFLAFLSRFWALLPTTMLL